MINNRKLSSDSFSPTGKLYQHPLFLDFFFRDPRMTDVDKWQEIDENTDIFKKDILTQRVYSILALS